MSITVRTLSSLEEYHQAEKLQHDIWGMADMTDVVPLSLLVTAQKNGGLVASVFTASEQMIGFVFGFMGLTKDGKFKHCSHMMGVLPEFRRQGVGETLKRFQRDYVLAQGAVDLVTWTYDPLESVNAFLNIARLGGIVRTYHENVYGDMPDSLNRGLRSDRFEIEWWIASDRVSERVNAMHELLTHSALMQNGAQMVNAVALDKQGALHPTDANLDLQGEILLVEIPAEFQAIKMISMSLAQEWRGQTATIFEHYFARGYSVTDFVSDREDNRRRNFYVLGHI